MAENNTKRGPGHGPGGPRGGFRKPKDLRGTLSKLMGYLGRYKALLVIVVILLFISAACSVAGSYLIKPLINDYILPGDFIGLAKMLCVMAGVYVVGAVCSYGYARIMVHVAQNTVAKLRADLFNKMQKLPLKFFDTHTHGELMSRYTNDIETVSEALNNSFASLISCSLTFLGTVAMMIVLSPILTAITFAMLAVMLLVVKTFKEQQRKQGLGPYSFTRDCDRPTDSQINNGWGAPVKPVGLIVSSFRPSDDATQYGFLIPSNMFAVVSLRQLAEIEDKVYGNKDFSGKCIALADEVDAAIRRYGTFNHPVCGRIYAFEVDGFGNALCMDDANVPSLLAAPYLGYCSFKDAIYQNTRKMIWSGNNPYFFKGKAGEGVGGPHVGLNYIWPMSIIMKAFTTDDSEEIRACLKQLRDTDGGTGFMHESFHSEDAADFTRSWFAWTNTLFGELILNTIKEYPNLLSQIL